MTERYEMVFVLMGLLVGLGDQSKDASDTTLEKSKVVLDYFNSSEGTGEEMAYRTPCSCYCGDQSILSSAYVSGGEETGQNEFPWLSLLYRRGKAQCGGVLITLGHVVTAAHCIYGYKMTEFDVGLGVHSQYYDDGMDQWRKVSRGVFHKQYNPSTLNHDIGILVLSEEVKLTRAVKPACLPLSNYEVYTGETGTIAGWGLSHPGSGFPNKPRKIALTIRDSDDCKSASLTHEKQLTYNMACIGYRGSNKGPCIGDSGGPVHVTYKNGIREVIGIISWALKNCDAVGAPSVFTKLSNYLGWIDDRVWGCRCTKRDYDKVYKEGNH